MCYSFVQTTQHPFERFQISVPFVQPGELFLELLPQLSFSILMPLEFILTSSDHMHERQDGVPYVFVPDENDQLLLSALFHPSTLIVLIAI